MKTVEEIKEILANATCSEQYHKFFFHPAGPYCTDGARDIAEAAGAWWLLDAIASHQGNRRLDPTFQVWKLTRNKTGQGAMLRGYNDTTPIVSQRISYTDFPLSEITFWVEMGECGGKARRIILLPSEH